MTRRLLAILLLLLGVPALTLAQNRYESDCDSTADFTSTSGVTFTSAGKCGGAVVLDADSDVAAWYAIGTTHCTSQDIYPECTAAGEQLRQVSIQFWYSCDTNGDGTCDVTPAYSSNLLSRDQDSHTPTILKYDGSAPFDTFRTYNTGVQHSLPGVDLMDGAWHRIFYTYDIDANKRKFCVDDVCVEDTADSVLAFAAGTNSLMGFLAGSDPDLCWGAYDEFQLAYGYDVTFSSDGPGCSVPPEEAASIPTQDTGYEGTFGTSFVTGGCGSYAHQQGCKIEIEIRADQDDKSPLFYHGFAPITGDYSFRTSIVFDKPWEWGTKYVRVRCQDGFSGCTEYGSWSQWAEWFGEAHPGTYRPQGAANHGVPVYADDLTRHQKIDGQDPQTLDGGEVGWTADVDGGPGTSDYDSGTKPQLYGNSVHLLKRKLPGARYIVSSAYTQAGETRVVIASDDLSLTNAIWYVNPSDSGSSHGWILKNGGSSWWCNPATGRNDSVVRVELIERDDGKHLLRALYSYSADPNKPYVLIDEIVAEDDCQDWAGKTLPFGPGYVGIGHTGATNYYSEFRFVEAGPLSAEGRPAASRRAP